jgi:hypothetical protein
LLLGACAQQQQASICTSPLKAALQVDLYLGRDTPNGEVTEGQWASFLAEEVTSRFPDGLSVLEVQGQFLEPSGRLTRERSKLLTIVLFDRAEQLPKIAQVANAYARRFGQHSVFRVERTVCAGAAN